MERHPADGVVADQTGAHHELSEAGGVDAGGAVPVEVDAVVAEEVDGVGSVGVTRDVEVGEIKLPDAAVAVGVRVGELAVGVGEGEAELNEVESVDVGLEEGVVVGWGEGAAGVGVGLEDDAGELGVHGNEGIAVHKCRN